jgi:hypothetical protein
MPPLSPARRTERARKAALSQKFPPDHPLMVDADRNLAVLRLEAYIEKTLAEAPPLTEQQRARLRELLKPVQVGAAS